MISLFAFVLALASPNPTMLARALDPNPALSTYVAAAELVVRTHPLPIVKHFTGTAYYANGTRTFVFDAVPAALSRFRVLKTAIPSYAQATADYDVEPATDDGHAAVFTLLPKHTGSRVRSLDVSVDERSDQLSRIVWHYADGSTLQVDEHYTLVGTFTLESKLDLTARFPGYTVDGTVYLSNYRTNVPVSPPSP